MNCNEVPVRCHSYQLPPLCPPSPYYTIPWYHTMPYNTMIPFHDTTFINYHHYACLDHTMPWYHTMILPLSITTCMPAQPILYHTMIPYYTIQYHDTIPWYCIYQLPPLCLPRPYHAMIPYYDTAFINYHLYARPAHTIPYHDTILYYTIPWYHSMILHLSITTIMPA